MTLKQIAEQIQIHESTLRLYRDEFDEFIPASGEGRRRRYESSGLGLLKQIAEWKRQGRSAVTIRQELARTTTPQEKRKAVTQEERIAEIAATLAFQTSEIALLRAEIGALRAEVGRLVEAIQSSAQNGNTIEAVQRERLLARNATLRDAERR